LEPSFDQKKSEPSEDKKLDFQDPPEKMELDIIETDDVQALKDYL
jgi:hypothetical protein